MSANELRSLVPSFSSAWHCTTQRHFSASGMQTLDEATKCQSWVRQKNCSKWCARTAFLADTNQATLGHHPSYYLGSRRLGTVTALLLPPGNAACGTLDHHLLKGCFLFCVLPLIINLSCHVMTVLIIMNSSGANVHVISTVTGDGKAKQTNQPTNFFLSLLYLFVCNWFAVGWFFNFAFWGWFAITNFFFCILSHFFKKGF